MPRIKYLGSGCRILVVSGLGAIKLAPGEEVSVEDRVAYRMLEANSTGRKPLYEFLDKFPPEPKEEILNIKQEVVLPEPPEGLLPPSFKKFGYPPAKPSSKATPKRQKSRVKQPDIMTKGK